MFAKKFIGTHTRGSLKDFKKLRLKLMMKSTGVRHIKVSYVPTTVWYVTSNSQMKCLKKNIHGLAEEKKSGITNA